MTVTDEFGCEDVSEVTVVVNEAVDADALPFLSDYCHEGTGSATVIIYEGTGPFNITWENVEGGEEGSTISPMIGTTEITGLFGGETYCIQILDANGCSIILP